MGLENLAPADLLDGRDGMGVSIVEARELARRFGGTDFTAIKYHQNWFIVRVDDIVKVAPGAAVRAWSIMQVVRHLEDSAGAGKGWIAPPRPEPAYRIPDMGGSR